MKRRVLVFIILVTWVGCSKSNPTIDCEKMLANWEQREKERDVRDRRSAEILKQLTELHDPKVNAILYGRYVPDCEDVKTGKQHPCPSVTREQ